MKDPHEKGVANPSAPSFARQAARPAVKRKQRNRWAGYGAPKICHQGADALTSAEGPMTRGDSASLGAALRSRRPQTRLDTFGTRTGRPRGGPSHDATTGAGLGRAARVHVSAESDRGVVPMKPAHNDRRPSAESADGRPRVKEKAPFTSHAPDTERGFSRVPGVLGCTASAPATRRYSSATRAVGANERSYGSVGGGTE